jgi:hypothetical protein
VSEPIYLNKKPVRVKTAEAWIIESLNYIINIVEAKKALVIKSRDLETYLGIYDHSTKIKLGLVLKMLKEAGLAERWNRSKPRCYKLTPRTMWRVFIKICKRRRFSCRAKRDSCRLVGTCPYWRLINHIEAIREQHA